MPNIPRLCNHEPERTGCQSLEASVGVGQIKQVKGLITPNSHKSHMIVVMFKYSGLGYPNSVQILGVGLLKSSHCSGVGLGSECAVV